MTMPDGMLDDITYFRSLFRTFAGMRNPSNPKIVQLGQLYCPPCGGIRRLEGGAVIYDEPTVVLVLLRCPQCDAEWTAVWRNTGADGPGRLVILPNFDGGGIATPHTPTGVAYYLGQAGRAISVGAQSAAVAMYRAGLEHLLLEQGFTDRMLGPKIVSLEAAILANSAPTWARDLETDYLKVLKDLGNASIHAADIAKQDLLDVALLNQVTTLVSHLLFIVYEAPHEKDARLQALRGTVAAMKK